MKTIRYKDILSTYERIDFYRAKYRHNDFTLHAWCFHGNKAQNWSGTATGSSLNFTGELVYNTAIAINAGTHKYVTIRLSVPQFTPSLNRYKIIFTYRTASYYTKELIVPAFPAYTTLFFNMENESNWTGTIAGLKFKVQYETSADTWADVTAKVYCEYVKVDRENVFYNVLDDETATTVDFNEMRTDLETFAKQSIAWEHPGITPNRVRQYIDIIKGSDIDLARSKISTLAPYNGCATCDSNVCQCDGTNYGGVGCVGCDVCNAYQACSCDNTCYQEVPSCTCNVRCYGDTVTNACTCNQICYGYAACSCNATCNTCYAANQLCYMCDNSRYESIRVCPCDTTCYSHQCTYEGTDTIANCYSCYVRCDVVGEIGDCIADAGGCRTYCAGQQPECECNQACYLFGSTNMEHACGISCDVEHAICAQQDTTQVYMTCSQCDFQCYQQSERCSVCYIAYGINGYTQLCSSAILDNGIARCPSDDGQVHCTACHNICYLEPVYCSCDNTCFTQGNPCSCNMTCYGYIQRPGNPSCSCDSLCYVESHECPCYATCYGYQSCKTCDACYGYQKCTCDNTAYNSTCSQCHKFNYSSVPI